MLRLCESDNLGQRDQYGTLLTLGGRHTEALSWMQAMLDSDGYPPQGETPPPSKEPLSAERMTDQRFARAEVLYSSALAAFRLWGDCELARQYLLMGAQLNPQILIKILAKIDRPSTSRPSCTHPITLFDSLPRLFSASPSRARADAPNGTFQRNGHIALMILMTNDDDP